MALALQPLVLGLGVPELLIILAVVLLLFGGARLAGIGKSTGRAIKEFKEETRGLKESDAAKTEPSDTRPPTVERPPTLESDASYPPYPPTQGTAQNSPPGESRRDA
jgi:sec-independent protein translocase protein TatA